MPLRSPSTRSALPRIALAIAILSAASLLQRSSLAQTTPSAPPQSKTYHWELIATGVPLGALAAWSSGTSVLDNDLSDQSRDRWRYAFYASAPLWLASGPAIHLAHGADDRMWSSLTLRAAAPIVLALAGSLIGLRYDCPGNRNAAEWGTECWPQGMIAGLSLGFIAAPVLDAFFIARPIPPPYVGPQPSGVSTRVTLLPTPDGKGRSVSVIGTF